MRALLRAYTSREDLVTYEGVLRDILAEFGGGIHDSLSYTMGKYLERTDGDKATSKLAERESNAATDLYSHNNFE